MASLRLNIRRLNAEGLVAKADSVIQHLEQHAVRFPDPSPSLAVAHQHRQELLDATAAALDGGRRAHQRKRTAVEVMKKTLRQLANYVAQIANGDAMSIIDGGFEVRRNASPPRRAEAPSGLTTYWSGRSGGFELRWKGVPLVRMYQVHICDTDPEQDNAKWLPVGLTSKARYALTGLEPFRPYWVRVTAITAGGEGPASDIVMGRAA